MTTIAGIWTPVFKAKLVSPPNQGTKKRCTKLVQWLSDGILEGVYTMSLGDLCDRLYAHSQKGMRKSNMRTVVKEHLGFVRTALTEIPGYATDLDAQRRYKEILDFQTHFLGADVRNNQKLRDKEKQALEDAGISADDFREMFAKCDELLTKAQTILDTVPNPSPDEMEAVTFAMVFGLLLHEPNVRLRPYSSVMLDGNTQDSNAVVVEKAEHGKVVLFFNDVKRSENVPIVLVVQYEPLRRLIHKYRWLCSGKRGHSYFFENKMGRPFPSFDAFGKFVNGQLRQAFGDGITSRLVRIIETIVDLDENRKFTVKDLEEHSYARNHRPLEAMKYDRTNRMEV
jgi:hypothetical protein